MITCTECGERNPEHARFCLACGAPLPEHPSLGARRIVTIVFCDLVGSTEMGARMDPESMRWILDRFFGLIKSRVELHGGRVEKFIGDAAVAVFGLPRVHEDDPLRATRAAIAIRDSVIELDKEVDRQRGITLATRIGINTGEVVTGDPAAEAISITGAPVNLAARLEQIAEPGEIVVGQDTFRLIHDAVTAEEVGPVRLKGFDEPVLAHRVLKALPAAPGRPHRSGPPLVDRDVEGAVLGEVFDDVSSGGHCRSVTVLGPPGIGKSRLVEEFVRAHAHETTTLSGRCLSYGDGITFWPISEIVQWAAGLTTADDSDTALAKIRDLVPGIDREEVVARRVGQALGLVRGTPSLDEIFWAIRRLFEALSTARPLTLVVEDIHWAEPKLLDLIEYIGDRSRDSPILVIATARLELLDARASWGTRVSNATAIILEPLEAADANAILRDLLAGGELDPVVRARIVEIAGGYPLFVEAIVTHLIDEGSLVREGDRWAAASDISELATPPSISGLLASRLDRLEPSERAVTERAALIGRDFRLDEVIVLSPEGSDEQVRHDLDSLVRKELIRRLPSTGRGGDNYSFRHMLLRDAAYEGMRKSIRAELHERFANWITSQEGLRIEPYQEIIAYHLEEAFKYRAELGPVNEDVKRLSHRAGAYAAEAGRRAVERGDMPATVKLLGKAATLIENDDPARLALLPWLADALFQMGQHERAESILDAMLEGADRIDDPVLEARARMERYTWRLVTDPGGVSVDELQRVVVDALETFERSGGPDQVAAGLEVIGVVYRLTGKMSAMLDAGERALGLGETTSSAATTSADTMAQALLMGPTPCEVAYARLESLKDAFANEPMVHATIALPAAIVLAMLERFGEARALADESAAVFDELSQARYAADAAHVRGLIDWWDGDTEAAERAMRSSHRSFEDRGETGDAALVAADLAQILLDLGRHEEADVLAKGIERDAPSFWLEQQIGWRRVSAKVAAKQGDLAAGAALAHEAVQLASSTDMITVRSDALTDLADVCSPHRPVDAVAAAEAALDLCLQKGSLTGARRARSALERATSGQ